MLVISLYGCRLIFFTLNYLLKDLHVGTKWTQFSQICHTSYLIIIIFKNVFFIRHSMRWVKIRVLQVQFICLIVHFSQKKINWIIVKAFIRVVKIPLSTQKLNIQYLDIVEFMMLFLLIKSNIYANILHDGPDSLCNS